MPIECVWMGEDPLEDGSTEGPRKVGMAFWSPYEFHLSEHYKTFVRPFRRPIMVMLPYRPKPGRNPGFACPWIIDSHPTSDPAGAWDVKIEGPLIVGERPRITVSPSIKCQDIYHGFLQDGFLTDDIGD